MQNWELPHIWKSKENWQFQCRWILWSLQNCVWSNGMLLPFFPCQETRPSLNEKDIERGKKWEGWMTWDVSIVATKITKSKRCEWWQNFKTNEKTKNLIRSNFPYERPLSTNSLLGKIRYGSLYGYIPCDLVVPVELKAKFSKFPPFFKNTEVWSNGMLLPFFPCQETRPSLNEKDIERGKKWEGWMTWDVSIFATKITKSKRCEWWQNFKMNEKFKNHIRSNFPYKRPLSIDSLLRKIRDGCLYVYFPCDWVVSPELKAKIFYFPPFFQKNTEVGRNYVGESMQNYAIENDLLKHPQRMLISSFKLENGSILTLLFIFHMELGLQCTKIYHFVQYLRQKSFNNFVQSVVGARRKGDENPLSGAVAETMKLLGNSS